MSKAREKISYYISKGVKPAEAISLAEKEHELDIKMKTSLEKDAKEAVV